MNIQDLQDVFEHEMKDIYAFEKQIIDALPGMADAASSSELQQAFRHHLDVTQRQFDRVREMCDRLDINPGNKVCKGMQGLLAEGEEIAKARGSGAPKDAALIPAAQRVEHYEIAAYGSARNHARLLGHNDVASELQDILDEEEKADATLTKLAEGGINEAAARA